MSDSGLEDIFQFKITIFGIEPPIWRQIMVPSQFTFYEFHVAIQDAMGWKHRQPYVFRGFQCAPGLRIFRPQPSRLTPKSIVDYQIRDYLNKPLDKAIYQYDLMEHIIELECFHLRTLIPTPLICIGGERACPPDGIGGVANYQNHVEVLSDLNHPQHNDCLAWLSCVGGPFNPDYFSVHAVLFSNALTRFFTTP